MTLQRVTWSVERFGWLVLFALIVLALLGLFANGPISSTSVTDSTGRLEAEYGRFERNGASTELHLRVAPGSDHQATILVSSSFMEAYKIESITPQPTEQRGGPDGVELTFRGSGVGPLHIYLGVRPQVVGFVNGAIGIPGEPLARLTQFVFP